MFTGIVEETGEVISVEARAGNGVVVEIEVGAMGDDIQEGDSLAVNGCCLTVAGLKRSRGGFRVSVDLLEETLARTSLRLLRPGGRVNLERAMSASGRFGGHFVTGHVDGVGVIRTWEPRGPDWFLELDAPKEVRPYLVSKGSIAVDGISLTLAKVTSGGKRIQIWIIPHTLQVTSLRERHPGDIVNLEADILAKYVEKLLPKARRR